MTATMQLDPELIHVTNHVIERYMERREWKGGTRKDAELSIRTLLRRVVTQCPPLQLRANHKPARFYTHGDLVWVISGDLTAVVTFWKRRKRK